MRYTVFVNATNVHCNASFFDEMNLRVKVELEYESPEVLTSRLIDDIKSSTSHFFDPFIIYDPMYNLNDRRPLRQIKQFNTISSLNEYGVTKAKDHIQLYLCSLPVEYDFSWYLFDLIPMEFIENSCTNRKMIDHFSIEWNDFDSALIEYCTLEANQYEYMIDKHRLDSVSTYI